MDENNSNRYYETLARYLCSEMDETESKAFVHEISGSGENLLKLEKMKKQWSAIGAYGESHKPDTVRAWDKLHARLQGDNLIPDKVGDNRKIMLPSFLRVAAIGLILIAAAAVIYLNTRPGHSPDMVQLATGSENNTLIKTLSDGSVIYLAQNTQFSFPNEFETGARSVVLKGEAFFDVASDPEKPFIIETDEATVQVLGTAFNVKTLNGNGFELVVDRGKVKVTLKKNPTQSRLVVAGEKIATVKNSLVVSRQVSSDEWYKNRMHFKDESLSNIINVLNRNYNTKFAVANSKTGSRRMTVTFVNDTPDTMAELICMTLNLKSQLINGSVVLSEKPEN